MTATEHADVILRDGGTLRLRSPGRDDADALLAFFAGLSSRSLYLRFHGLPELGPRLVESLAEPDWQERGVLLGALVDEDGERVVAVANYVRLRDPKLAETAFAVADEQQGRGIGTRLLEQLAERAAEVGIERFMAYVMADNRAMRRRLRGGGIRADPRVGERRAGGAVPDRRDRGLPRPRRRTRPPSGRGFAETLLRAAQRGGDRRLQAARVDRRRAVPQHPGRRFRGRRLPGQP